MDKAARTKKFIIEKSAFLINKKGMAGTSLSDIMEVTQLAKGGIYGNFNSKEEICLESFSYLVNTLSNQMDKAIIAGGNTAKEKFFALLDFYSSNKTTEGGCPMLNFGTESDDTNPKMRARVKTAIREMQNKIYHLINAGVANNEISAKIDPKTFSIRVFALLEGGILCKRVLGINDQMKVIIEAIKREFESYLL